MADKGGFDPYENRNVVNPISNLGAFVSLLKCVIGTGILALPLAFYYAGIVTGILLLVLATFMLIHGMQLLIYSMVECSRRLQVGYATFPQSMAFSFREGPKCFKYCARAGSYFVDVVLAFSHYGTCVVYLVFVASNLKQIIDFYSTVLDVRIYVAIVGLLSIPVFMIRSLKWLVPFNLLANILIYSSFCIMFYYMFTGLPSLADRYIWFGDYKNMGLFFGIALFSVSSVGVMLAIEAKMKKPKEYLGWFGILDRATLVVVISYVLFGFFGYWRYGDELQGSISLNLPTHEAAAQASKILIAMAIFLTYPLSGYVVIDIIMTHYWNKSGELSKAALKETIVRLLFILVSTINGVVAPNLGPLLSLVGAFTISLLNLIFPALMEICLYYPPEYNYGKYRWKLVKDITLVILGTIILVEGTVFAILAMISEYGGHDTKTTKGDDTTATTIADNTTIATTGGTTATTGGTTAAVAAPAARAAESIFEFLLSSFYP